MRSWLLLFLIILLPVGTGCDRIYGLLHKPGGEERVILGNVQFNEYNPKVEDVQKYLRILGYHIGRPDGKFGAGTRDAVAKFQGDEGIEVTRFVDKATWAQLQYYVQSPLVKKDVLSGQAVQKALVKAGYDPGRLDGQLGPQTKSALRKFQKEHQLTADGVIGLKTIKALLQYLVK
jgi:peptidoglycan hydrolase-like protein with peptidoglycan-binding domain